MISGYLGETDEFDQAMTEVALAYADQTKRDHVSLVNAVKTGRVEAGIAPVVASPRLVRGQGFRAGALLRSGRPFRLTA